MLIQTNFINAETNNDNIASIRVLEKNIFRSIQYYRYSKMVEKNCVERDRVQEYVDCVNV